MEQTKKTKAVGDDQKNQTKSHPIRQESTVGDIERLEQEWNTNHCEKNPHLIHATSRMVCFTATSEPVVYC